MKPLRFRVFFDGIPASVEDLAAILSLSVEQAEDAAWEAQLVMMLGLDEQGNWSGSRAYRLRARTPVRVEIKIGDAAYAPLIDGPIVAIDSAMDASPGRSTVTVTVHDDSAWLNRERRPVSREGRTVEQIVRELFLTSATGRIVSTQIEFPPGSPPSLGPSFAEQGTAMQMLQAIAKQNGCRAFVLPGPVPGVSGASIGCLKPDPAPPGDLPDLILLGANRNLAKLTVTEDPETAERTVARTLRLGDQQFLGYTTSLSDEDLLESTPAAGDAPERQLSPAANDSEDPTARARARARRTNDPIRFQGSLIPGVYPAVLTPHQIVTARAGGARTSTLMRVTSVAHTITPSTYTVEFEGRGNAFAELAGAAPGLPSGVF